MNKRKQFWTVVSLVIILLILLFAHANIDTIKGKIRTHEIEKARVETLEEAKIPEKIETKQSAYIDVPFICQAPLETEENWTKHEESCEEAAILQAYTYLKGGKISKEKANEVILDMIKWQKENFEGHHDIYAHEVRKLINGYYSIPLEKIIVKENATIEDIKALVSEGNPVIAPITGNILQNPYYPHPGYHMLVIKGYTENKIITNDNGTKRGKDYSYDIEIFKEALEDAGGDILTFSID